MASNVQISIKDEASAKRWLETVQLINEDYIVAMQEASDTLTSMKDFADGTLVDDIYNFGTDLLQASQQIFEGIDSIADTVGDICQIAGEFINEAKDSIKKAFNSVFGR